MRKIRNYSIAIIAITFIIAISSCSKDTNSNPSTSGTTTSSGDLRAGFVGNWKCTETSSITGNSIYYVQISLSPTNPAQIQIGNFYNLGVTVIALANVTTSTSFILPQQLLVGQTLQQGTGTLQNAVSISLAYSMNNGSQTDNLTCALVKQ